MNRTVPLVMLAAGLLPAMSLAIAGKQTSELRWKNVQYLGGAPGVRVSLREPEHILILTRDKIVLKIRPPAVAPGEQYARSREEQTLLELPSQGLVSVEYLSFRHYKPVTKSLIGIPGVEPKAIDHLIIVEYRLPQGDTAEILLRVHKNDYQEILNALRSMLPRSPT